MPVAYHDMRFFSSKGRSNCTHQRGVRSQGQAFYLQLFANVLTTLVASNLLKSPRCDVFKLPRCQDVQPFRAMIAAGWHGCSRVEDWMTLVTLRVIAGM